jgi:Zn-dependent protease with chaperone function
VGYLVHIVLALAAQGLAESGVTTGLVWPLAPLLLAPAPYLLGALSRRLLVRGRFRSGQLFSSLMGWSPALCHAAALLLFGWDAVVERWTGVPPRILEWPHPVVFLALAPFVLYVVLAVDARARLAGVIGLHAARRFHLRLFVTGFAPFVAWIVAAWAVGRSERLRVNVEEVGVFAALFAGALFAVFLVLLPWLVRNAWDTRPLPPGPLRDALEALARHADFRCRGLLLWGTGQSMANAAVVGLGARHRIVLFSDALLLQLPVRELVAVFAHEIAHVKRRHVQIFLCTALAVFLAADLLSAWIAPESELLGIGIVIAVFVLWYVAFGWLSRRFELEADLWSAELTRDPQAMISALERVGSPHGRRLTSWRHFSTEVRSRFLLRNALDPSVGAGLRRVLARVTYVSIALMLVVLAAEGWVVSRGFSGERLRVDLRLGRYAQAEERLAAMEQPDPDLGRMIGRALELGPESGVERLVSAARDARRRGDEEAVNDYLELAALRGWDGAQNWK